jgi:hypothetical protein
MKYNVWLRTSMFGGWWSECVLSTREDPREYLGDGYISEDQKLEVEIYDTTK